MSEKPVTRRFELEHGEMMLLDGTCSDASQSIINEYKQALALTASGLTHKQGAMVAKIVATAKKNGKLAYSIRQVSSCPCCGASAGYATYKSSSRYHDKGDVNRDKPLSLNITDLDGSFVRVSNYSSLGFCQSCKEIILPILLLELEDVRAEIPEKLTGHAPKFRWHQNKVCACGWTGHEGQMGRLYALMGGTYPGSCPSCKAENTPFGRTIIATADGFTLTEATP